ncbi:MAG: gamma-glutamyl-gamma-aminobutyrate hydrolase family protein [Bacteroidales bacterium]
MIKKILIPLLLSLVLTPVGLQAQDTLLLFHPTAYNLELMNRLSEENILDLGGIHVLGVFHRKEVYDFSQSDTYLKGHPDLPFSLREIDGTLDPASLYGENDCTADFITLFDHSIGALFMGGPDIPPLIYHENTHLLTSVTDPFRHYLEISFLFHLLGGNQDPGWEAYLEMDPAYLVSGICLGMQTLNVATGGTLVQDIPTEIYGIWQVEDLLSLPPDQLHRNDEGMILTDCRRPTSYHFHAIQLEAEGFLVRELGFDPALHPLVLSAHHQCVEKLGKGWKTAASSMDGRVVEAIEHIEYPHVIGVQFHPEKPGLFDPSIVHPLHCNEEISFHDRLKGTYSYDFHLAYWKYLGQLLKESKQ